MELKSFVTFLNHKSNHPFLFIPEKKSLNLDLKRLSLWIEGNSPSVVKLVDPKVANS